MTYMNIIGDAIEYIPRKTKEDRPITVRVPLSKTAIALIDKYREGSRAFARYRDEIDEEMKKGLVSMLE